MQFWTWDRHPVDTFVAGFVTAVTTVTGTWLAIYGSPLWFLALVAPLGVVVAAIFAGRSDASDTDVFVRGGFGFGFIILDALAVLALIGAVIAVTAPRRVFSNSSTRRL